MSVRDTCPESYSYLSVLCVLYLTACDAAEHLSVLYSVGERLSFSVLNAKGKSATICAA